MNDPKHFPPLQPLLFLETGLLLYVAGIIGARHELAALTTIALIIFIDGRIRRVLPALFALLCAFSGLWAGLRAEPPVSLPAPGWLQHRLETYTRQPVTGTILSVQGLPDRRLRLILEAVTPLPPPLSPELPSDSPQTTVSTPLPGHLVLTVEALQGPRPIAGQQVAATLSIRPVRGFLNAGLWDSGDYWRRQGVFFQAWTKAENLRVSGTPFPGAALRERLRSRLEFALAEIRNAATPSSASSLIPALLFGDRFALTTSDGERVNAAGLSHSLALSGQHLAVVGLGALFFVACTGLTAPGVFLHVPAFALLGLLSLPLAGLYLWLGDAPPSLVRSALMLSFWCLPRFLASRLPEAVAFRFSLNFPDVLLLALGCMVFTEPLCLYDAGVQLSFSAVAGMALMLPLARRLWHAGPLALSHLQITHRRVCALRVVVSRLAHALWLTFASTCAAQLSTLPLVLDLFGRSTLYFPLNLLWLPVLGLWVLPLAFCGLFALSLGLDSLASLLLYGAEIPCNALLQSLLWLEHNAGMQTFAAPRPHWTALLGWAALFVAFALKSNHSPFPPAGRRLCLSGCLLLTVGPLLWVLNALSPTLTLRVLDVGQGQAVLIEWPNNGRALIDGGGFRSPRFDSGRDLIAPILTNNNIPQLDFIALSHPDTDHLKGLLYLAAHTSPKAVLTAAHAEPDEGKLSPLTSILALHGIPRHTLQAGDSIPLTGDLRLDVLAPEADDRPSGNDGLILRLVFKGRGLALLPGDAEKRFIHSLVATGRDLSAEVLVLPHHGSAGSFSPDFYEAVSPRLVVASAGAYNPYRLPARKVREELIRRGLPLHVTGEKGEAVLRWNLDATAATAPLTPLSLFLHKVPL